MDWKQFDYSLRWRDGGISREPVINVVLSKNGKNMSQRAMIDSGAEGIIVSEEVAEFLGIDKNKCESITVTGIVGDSVPGFMADVNLKVDGFDDSFESQVIFVTGLKFGMLLGQTGFFDKFRVKFDLPNNTFSLISIEEEKESKEHD